MVELEKRSVLYIDLELEFLCTWGYRKAGDTPKRNALPVKKREIISQGRVHGQEEMKKSCEEVEHMYEEVMDVP